MKRHELQNGTEDLFTKECQPGYPAVSLAGHDKGELFLIIECSDDYVFLADGKVRTLDHAKRKKRKHIQICKERLIQEFPTTDEIIRRELKQYMKNHCSVKEV